MVVKFPLSGGVMNCSMVTAPNGNMARFFDGKGRALAGFNWVFKPWNKADTIKIVYWRKLAQFNQSRENVYEADWLSAALAPIPNLGSAYDQGDSG